MNTKLIFLTALLTFSLYTPASLSAGSEAAKDALPSIITYLLTCEVDQGSDVKDEILSGMARFKSTGETISSLSIIDADTPNPATTITNAGMNSLVVIDGRKGPITLESIVSLSEGQVLLGGGGSLQIEVGDDSQTLTYAAPCIRPNIVGHIGMVSNTRLVDLTIEGQGLTSTVRLNGIGPFTLDGVSVTNIDTNQEQEVTLANGVNTFDISKMGIFGSEYSGLVAINNSSFITHSQPAFLSTDLDATIEVSNSLFEGSSGISNGIELSSFADAVVDAQFANSTFVNSEITNTGGEEGAIGVIFAFEDSELNVNFTDSIIRGLVNSAGVSLVESFDNATLKLDFLRTNISGGEGGANGPGIDEVSAQDNSKMLVTFSDLSVTGMTKDGIDFVGTYDNAVMSMGFDNVDILGGSDTGDEEGIDGFRSEDSSFLTVGFVDSTIIGTDNDGIEEIESRDSSVLTVDFLRTEIGVNLLDPLEEDEGIEEISADDQAELYVSFQDSVVTGINRSAIGHIDARDQSNVSINMETSRFLGSSSAAVNLESIETARLCIAASNNTFTSDPVLIIPGLNLVSGASSVFSIFPLSSLSEDNNNAIVAATGTFRNALICPSSFTPPPPPT